MEDFLNGIDWHLLKEQKAALLRQIGDLEGRGGDAEMDDADHLVGLLHLIDGLQDAADVLGRVPADAWLPEKAE